MNERNALSLSLSAIMASQDARRGGFLGLGAVSLHRLLLVIPALCALAYPSLLSWLSAGLAWLTRQNNSMLGSLSNLRLIAHYWVGPIAIVAHVACGLRAVLLQHDVSTATANRLTLALITLGVVASSLIIAALLNVHIA